MVTPSHLSSVISVIAVGLGCDPKYLVIQYILCTAGNYLGTVGNYLSICVYSVSMCVHVCVFVLVAVTASQGNMSIKTLAHTITHHTEASE